MIRRFSTLSRSAATVKPKLPVSTTSASITITLLLAGCARSISTATPSRMSASADDGRPLACLRSRMTSTLTPRCWASASDLVIWGELSEEACTSTVWPARPIASTTAWAAPPPGEK